MLKIYTNVVTGKSYDQNGDLFEDGMPQIFYKATEQVYWQLCTDTPDLVEDQSQTPDEDWAKSTEYANIGAVGAFLTADSDYVKRLPGKLAAVVSSGSVSSISAIVNDADQDTIPTSGVVSLFDNEGNSETVKYTARTIGNNNSVTFTLASGSALEHSYAAEDPMDCSQEPLAQATLDTVNSDVANGLFVFSFTAFSRKLHDLAAYSDTKEIDVRGLELAIFRIDGDTNAIIDLQRYEVDTFSVRTGLAETATNPPLTSAEENATVALVNDLLAAGFSLQYSSDGENWHDTQVTTGDDIDIYFRFRSSASGGQWSSAIRLVKGDDGTDGEAGVRGSRINYGTSITGTSTTPTTYATGISDSLENDMYLNTSTMNAYQCTLGGDASTAKWKYIGTLQGVSAYTYVAYASNSSGSGFSLSPSDSLKYRSEIHKTSPITTPTSSDFSGATWIKYLGDNGTNGVRGSRINYGTAVTGTSTTPASYQTGISDSLVGDAYINTSTQNLYQCTTAGNASAAKWAYAGTLKGSDANAPIDTVQLNGQDLTITSKAVNVTALPIATEEPSNQNLFLYAGEEPNADSFAKGHTYEKQTTYDDSQVTFSYSGNTYTIPKTNTNVWDDGDNTLSYNSYSGCWTFSHMASSYNSPACANTVMPWELSGQVWGSITPTITPKTSTSAWNDITPTGNVQLNGKPITPSSANAVNIKAMPISEDTMPTADENAQSFMLFLGESSGGFTQNHLYKKTTSADDSAITMTLNGNDITLTKTGTNTWGNSEGSPTYDLYYNSNNTCWVVSIMSSFNYKSPTCANTVMPWDPSLSGQTWTYVEGQSITPVFSDPTTYSWTDVGDVISGGGSQAISGSGAPTTSTEGTIGTLYIDTATSKIYTCYSIGGTEQVPVYNWKEGVYLGNDGKIASDILPVANANNLGAIKVDSNFGLQVASGTSKLQIYPADTNNINNRNGSYRPICPPTLDYAVRSVSPNITTIAANADAFNLLDASATTNNHSHTYRHTPTVIPTYTLPAVNDSDITHDITLEVDFSNVTSCSFKDAGGNRVVLQKAIKPMIGDLYVFKCEWHTRWFVMPMKVRSFAEAEASAGLLKVTDAVEGSPRNLILHGDSWVRNQLVDTTGTLVLNSSHVYLFNDNGTTTRLTNVSTQAVTADEDMLVDITQLCMGDATKIAAIQTWEDLVEEYPEYASHVTSDPGTVMGLSPIIKHDTEEYAYGIIMDTTQSAIPCQRVELHNGVISEVNAFSSTPAHDWRRCVMDDITNRHVNYYLDPTDSSKKYNGTFNGVTSDGSSSVLTGADGDVMVEMPIAYWRLVENYNGQQGKHLYLVSDKPFTGSEIHPFFYTSPNGDTPRVQYVGAYRGTVCNSEGSPLNTTEGAIAEETGDSSTRLVRSIAGAIPWSNMLLSEFRAAAGRNGAVSVNFDFHRYIYLMMVIEYANFNTQTISLSYSYMKTFGVWCFRKSGRTNYGNGTGETMYTPGSQDEEAFSSMKVGSTTFFREISSDANNYYGWSTHTATPTRYWTTSDTPENGSVAYSDTNGTDSGKTTSGFAREAGSVRVIQFQYRGIENPFGEIWEFEDGFQKYQNTRAYKIRNNSNTSEVYTRDNTQDGASSYAWTNTTAGTIWTAAESPAANSASYSDATLTTSTGFTVTTTTNRQYAGEYWRTVATNDYTSTAQHTSENPTYYREFHEWPSSGYGRTFDPKTFLPLTTNGDGSASAWFFDYFYNDTNAGTKMAIRDGHAAYGGGDGMGALHTTYAFSTTNVALGGRIMA